MINPGRNRFSYGKLLTPPGDYKLEFAVGTTYSLDLNALLGVPISLALSEEMEGNFMQNPIALLEGIRRVSDNFILFNEAGQIKVPDKLNFIYSLIENSVNEVALDNKKSFHPKVWVNKYVNIFGESIFRVIVLSRNLTFDRSWDMVVALEGILTKKRTLKNDGLQELLRALIPYCKKNDKKKKIINLIDELYYVQFDPMDEDYIDFNFLPFGVTKKTKQIETIIGKYNELIVISPFLSKGTIENLRRDSTGREKKTLITRKSEIEKLNQNIINDYEVYTLKDEVVLGEEMISETGEDNWRKQDIHAKFYGTSLGVDNTFYIGSNNCSYSAFNGNVEFLLELKYKKRGFRISILLEDLFGSKDNEKENPFERIKVMPKIEDTSENIEDKLEKTIKELCRTDIKGHVYEEEDKYILELTVSNFIENECTLTIEPLMSNQKRSINDLIVFDKLEINELGEFFKITAQLDNKSVSRVIKIDVANIPANRENEIFKSIIGDKKSFFRYVSFILSDNYLLELIQQLEQGNGLERQGNSYIDDSVILYENMLRTVAKEPNKIDELEKIMEIIGEGEIVPDEFKKLYDTFKNASKKVKR